MIERDEDGLIDASFDVSFRVPYKVLNINDSIINEKLVQAAALTAGKEAARNELNRQMVEAQSNGLLEEGWRVERD